MSAPVLGDKALHSAQDPPSITPRRGLLTTCMPCTLVLKATLLKHMRVHDAERPYGCSFPRCGWRFKSEVLLRAHLQAHITPGQFECPSCGYAFRHKHHLQHHQARMHSSRAKKPDVPPVAQLSHSLGSVHLRSLGISLSINSIVVAAGILLAAVVRFHLQWDAWCPPGPSHVQGRVEATADVRSRPFACH
ncbi:hypothetical protein KIL84_005332 [Mauremys mutica]|uniref:C2H2-type domain-containing protein n=1 Tax=Mauremys mutica TaxID=74926 RepID=A0A9D4B5Q9_9SAUR|nr:hypothetical protein KIL84_005332 [Mauremys mutica]